MIRVTFQIEEEINGDIANQTLKNVKATSCGCVI